MKTDPTSDPVYKTWISLLEKERREGYHELSAAETVFWNVYLLDLEVYNGGFLQYFGNSSMLHAAEVIPALMEIGAFETAEKVERLWQAVFQGDVPAEEAKLLEAANRLDHDYASLRSIESETTDWYCKDVENLFGRLEKLAGANGFLVR